jgi:hypothetical protein
MPPGFRNVEELAASKASPDYWAAGEVAASGPPSKGLG